MRPPRPKIHPPVNEYRHTDKDDSFLFDRRQILHATTEHATLISGEGDLPIVAGSPSHQSVLDRVGGTPRISQAKKKIPQTLEPEPNKCPAR